MGLFDTSYDDLNQPPRRPGLTTMPRASDASIPGQPSVPGVSRTVSRDSMGQDGASNYGNEGRGISAGQYSNVVSQSLSGAGPSAPAGGSTFASRMADRQGQRDAVYGSSPGGQDAEAQRVNGIYAREAAIRGLDGNGDPLRELDSRHYSSPIRTSIRERDQAEWDRGHMQGELSSIIHDLRVKNTTRSLASAAQLGQVLNNSLSAPEEMAVRRAQIEQNGELARRGQDVGLLESDARNKTGLSLGRMRDSTDRRGQDLANALGMQRDATDRRGQDMTSVTAQARNAFERDKYLTEQGAKIPDRLAERMRDPTDPSKPDYAGQSAALRTLDAMGGARAMAGLDPRAQAARQEYLIQQGQLKALGRPEDQTDQPVAFERYHPNISFSDYLNNKNIRTGDYAASFFPGYDGWGEVSTPRGLDGSVASRYAVPTNRMNNDQYQAALATRNKKKDEQ